MASIELKDRVLILTDGDEKSYVDLSVIKGDKGCRGPQGRAGVILDADGNIITEGFATEEYVDLALEGIEVDMTGYATEAYVGMVLEEKSDVEHVHEQYLTEDSLTDYATEDYVETIAETLETTMQGMATEEYVRQKVAEAQIEGAEVDLSDYATKSDIEGLGGVGTAGTGSKAEVFNSLITNKASGDYSHAEGDSTIASGKYSHVEGYDGEAEGEASHVEGKFGIARGKCSHVEGSSCEANGDYSHAEGIDTIAAGEAQHVQGKNNIIDTEGKYAHIVGNGSTTPPTSRSNAHTLDWNGNAWFAGGIILNSPNGTRWMIKVTDAGALSVTESEV